MNYILANGNEPSMNLIDYQSIQGVLIFLFYKSKLKEKVPYVTLTALSHASPGTFS